MTNLATGHGCILTLDHHSTKNGARRQNIRLFRHSCCTSKCYFLAKNIYFEQVKITFKEEPLWHQFCFVQIWQHWCHAVHRHLWAEALASCAMGFQTRPPAAGLQCPRTHQESRVYVYVCLKDFMCLNGSICKVLLGSHASKWRIYIVLYLGSLDIEIRLVVPIGSYL